MCEAAWLPKLLIWSFVGAAVVLALISRKLNDHLLVTPTQPTGPFAMLFRRKYHVRPSFLFDPERYFDTDGQPWVRRFRGLLLLAATLLLLLTLSGSLCGWQIGPPADGVRLPAAPGHETVTAT